MANKNYDIAATIRVIDQASSNLKKIAGEFKNTGGIIKRQTGSITGSSNLMSQAFGKLGDIGNKIKGFGSGALLTVTAPMTALTYAAATTAESWDKTLNDISFALSDISGISKEAFGEMAKDLAKGKDGLDTQIDALQTIQALSRSGFAKYPEQLKQVAEASLMLDDALGTTAGESAELIKKTMATFTMGADRAEEIANAWAGLSKVIGGDVTQMLPSMAKAGVIAAQAGISFQEYLAIMGKMRKGGMEATNAGRAFQAFILALKAPTEAEQKAMLKFGIRWDDVLTKVGEGSKATFKLKPMAEILKLMKDRGLSGANALEVFGDRVGPALEAMLSDSTISLTKLTDELKKEGAVVDAVSKKNAGLTGDMARLRNSWTDLKTTAGEELIPILGDLASELKGAVDGFKELEDGTKSFIVKGALLVGTVPIITKTLGSFITTVAGIGKLLISIAPFIATAIGGLVSAAVTIAPAVLPLTALYMLFDSISNNTKEWKLALNELGQGFLDLADNIWKSMTSWTEFKKNVTPMETNADDWQGSLGITSRKKKAPAAAPKLNYSALPPAVNSYLENGAMNPFSGVLDINVTTDGGATASVKANLGKAVKPNIATKEETGRKK